MLNTKRIVLIAGEESGDIHAAELAQQLKTRYPSMQLSGIGGQHMEKAGVELIYDLASHGVTGISEVLKHLHVIRRAFSCIKKHLQLNKPDLLILVDYPGFNLRLAKYAKRQLNLRILYYISPQIWAWKAKRIHLIRECVDSMAVILPFEKKLYEKAGVPVHFVGHPLVNKIKNYPRNEKKLTLPENKTIIALLPGSRGHEIQRHMPVFAESIKQLTEKFSQLHFVIPVAATISQEQIQQYLPQTIQPSVTLIQGHALEILSRCQLVIVASGTASLEAALFEKPMCIVYKASPFTYLLATRLIQVKYLGLCNLLMKKMIVPELLQYDFNSHELVKLASELLSNAQLREKMTKHLKDLTNQLSSKSADRSLIDLVESELANSSVILDN